MRWQFRQGHAQGIGNGQLRRDAGGKRELLKGIRIDKSLPRGREQILWQLDRTPPIESRARQRELMRQGLNALGTLFERGLFHASVAVQWNGPSHRMIRPIASFVVFDIEILIE